MKRSLTCLFFVLATAILHAQQITPKFFIGFYTGYERQDVTWSIAGNLLGQNPNVLSELKFRGVGGFFAGTDLRYLLLKKIYLNAAFSHTFITKGLVTDNDYAGDGRTQPVYNQTFNSDKGYTADYKAGLGYMVFNTHSFSLMPFAGYVISDQSLYILDRTGSFSDLNSTYHSLWKGVYVSAEGTYNFSKKIRLSANITYAQLTYKAKADWNLIQTFAHPISYHHHADGYSLTVRPAIAYHISPLIDMILSTEFYTRQTGKGIDELYLTNGTINKTQLNSVDAKGNFVKAGIIVKPL